MNTQVKLAVRPTGYPTHDTWNIEKNAIPTAGEGEMVVKNLVPNHQKYQPHRPVQNF